MDFFSFFVVEFFFLTFSVFLSSLSFFYICFHEFCCSFTGCLKLYLYIHADTRIYLLSVQHQLVGNLNVWLAVIRTFLSEKAVAENVLFSLFFQDQ